MPNNRLASSSRDQAVTAGQCIAQTVTDGGADACRIDPAVFEPSERPDEDWLGAMKGMFIYGPALSLGLYGVIAAAVWFMVS